MTVLRQQAVQFVQSFTKEPCEIKLVESKEARQSKIQRPAYDVFVKLDGQSKGKKIGTLIGV